MSEQAPHALTLTCTECNYPIEFPLNAMKKLPLIVECDRCHKQFGFQDGTIVQQIRQFICLCNEIKASEDILSSSAIAVRIDSQEVKIPFKLLLTRLRSTFDLAVGDKKLTLSYRTEPRKVAEALKKEEFESTL